jgi:hypothetical protein
VALALLRVENPWPNKRAIVERGPPSRKTRRAAKNSPAFQAAVTEAKQDHFTQGMTGIHAQPEKPDG